MAVSRSLLNDLAPRLLGLAQEHAVAHRKARPFPHVVLDGGFPAPPLDQVLTEWPTQEAIDWKIYVTPSEFKTRLRGCAAPRPPNSGVPERGEQCLGGQGQVGGGIVAHAVVTGAPLFEFEPESLRAIAEQRRGEYRSARPFPHVVLDDFLPEPVAGAVLAEWPGRDAVEWTTRDSGHERKYVLSDVRYMGPSTRALP